MGSLVVGGARTPFGKLLGGLAEHPATELGGFAIAAALERAGVPADAVDHVVMGQVLTAGCGQLPARQAAVAGGIGMSVPAVSVNKVCLSGLTAVALADQLIRAGECEVVVAGGMESMSRAPHLLPGSRAGHRYGDATLVDHLAADGLADVWTSQSMGALTESANVGPGRISREAQDAFSARSHQRAAAAAELLAEEIVAVRTPQRRGPDRVLTADEGVRPGTDAGTLAGLRPAFAADGTITAGSASPISDGAAAVVVASPAAVERLGLSPWAEVLGHGQVAGPDSTLQHQPAAAVRAACARAGVDPAALDLLEVNEAFAAVALASAADLGLGPEQVEEQLNVHGGAIALGHPIGASGARLVLHLAAELRRRGRRPDAGGGRPVLAAAALCGGGGQGDALVLRGVR